MIYTLYIVTDSQAWKKNFHLFEFYDPVNNIKVVSPAQLATTCALWEMVHTEI